MYKSTNLLMTDFYNIRAHRNLNMEYIYLQL